MSDTKKSNVEKIKNYFLSNDCKYKKDDNKDELNKSCRQFLVVSGFSKFYEDHENAGIYFCEKTILKIIDQARKRKLYFYIYHKIEHLDNLSELKEIALYSFWILKLQPFYWVKEANKKPNYELNAKIALNFFTRGLQLYLVRKNKNNTAKLNSHLLMDGIEHMKDEEHILGKLYYSFRFRDWSKESLMDLAESSVFEEPPPAKVPKKPQYKPSGSRPVVV